MKQNNKVGRPPKPYKTVRRHFLLRKSLDNRLRRTAMAGDKTYSRQAEIAIEKGLDALEAEEGQ